MYVISDQPDKKLCKLRDSDNCDYFFSYTYLTDTVEVQRTKGNN